MGGASNQTHTHTCTQAHTEMHASTQARKHANTHTRRCTHLRAKPGHATHCYELEECTDKFKMYRCIEIDEYASFEIC